MDNFIAVSLLMAGFAVALCLKFANYKWQVGILGVAIVVLLVPAIYSGEHIYFAALLSLLGLIRIRHLLTSNLVKVSKE